MYKETEKFMNELRNQYGELGFRSAITYLIDVGFASLNDESVVETKKEIMAEYNKMKSEGKTPFITGDFQCEILDCAYKISQIDKIELLVYVQENINYDVGQDTIRKDRVETLLKNTVSILYDKSYNKEDFVELLHECGFENNEIEKVGYASFLEKERTVKQLSKEELTELKQSYFLSNNNGSFDTSYAELAAIDELVTDQEIYDYYSDTRFVKDDFSCNQNEQINEPTVKMDHNEYQKHKVKIRFSHGITNNDDHISLKNIQVTDFDLSKYNLTDDMKKVINTCFATNDLDHFGNECFHGCCNKQNINKLIAEPLNCKIGCDCGNVGIYYNQKNRIILEFIEDTMSLSLFENDEKYNQFSRDIKKYYNKCFETNLNDYDLLDNQKTNKIKTHSTKKSPTIQTQPINRPKSRR